MKRYKLILFDIDGTLADTDAMLIESMNQLYDLYRDGVRTPYEKMIYFSGPIIEETLEHEFPHMDQKFIYDEFQRIFQGLYPKMLKEFPGGKEMLLSLKKNNYLLGIVTNKNHSSSLYCLVTLGYEGLFDVIVASDDVKNGKPYPDSIIKAMELTDVKNNNEVLYVGDNDCDYECASRANIDCMLVNWGPRELSTSTKPRYKINHFNELLEAIEQ